jgi:propionyl-CoA synthetase
MKSITHVLFGIMLAILMLSLGAQAGTTKLNLDPLKGQMPLAFAVVKDAGKLDSQEGRRALEKEVLETVDRQLGAIARPRAVHFVTLLPKTRSGKTLRRSIQALAEGRDPGDLTTIEDPGALEQIRNALKGEE